MPPTFRISKVEVLGLNEAIDWTREAEDTLNDPKDGLVQSTHAVAELWRANFVGEGSMHGRWQALADNTVRIRESLGFPGDHPILQRTGKLLQVGVEFFEKANTGDSASATGISASLSGSGSEVELSIAGRKVANQNGGGRLPARPFWVTATVHESAASEALQKWLEEKLDS